MQGRGLRALKAAYATLRTCAWSVLARIGEKTPARGQFYRRPRLCQTTEAKKGASACVSSGAPSPRIDVSPQFATRVPVKW